MRATTIEMMQDHVRAIHRALTGNDPPVADEGASAPSLEDVMQRFAELEALARRDDGIATRVPPFSYAPPYDVIGTERELLIEIGVPGVERGEVDVEKIDDMLIISGACANLQARDGRVYLHAELPRGPFRRVVQLPEPTSGSPRLEVENGVVRVRLQKASKSTLPQA